MESTVIKIDVKEYFRDCIFTDGNSLSYETRVEELAKHGFPRELTGLNKIVNNKQELKDALDLHFNIRKGEEK